ncbi:metallophosphoesterase [Alishewanella sp. SMS9]|nr:metallophosphoesterase [Alishewanella sp. SMS9]
MHNYVFPAKAAYRVVQITDCHLLAELDGIYRDCQPAVHLQAILAQLQLSPPDALILTGDLTQDHTLGSYQLLAQLCQELSCPVFVLPGNHEDLAMLAQLQQQPPFQRAESLSLGEWQLFLLNTKGPTPAGEFAEDRQSALAQQFAKSQAKQFWLFCHHHPQPLGCFIDKHGLRDQQTFWPWLLREPKIKGLAHGHAHLAYHKVVQGIDIVGCPASSVQFLARDDWQTVNAGPQWCEWYFAAAGQVSWQFKRL